MTLSNGWDTCLVMTCDKDSAVNVNDYVNNNTLYNNLLKMK